MKPNTKIERLSICMDFHAPVNDTIQKVYAKSVQLFVEEFNREPHLFKLDTCTNQSNSSFRIKIKPFRYVEKNTQIIAGVFNILGMVALPVILVASEAPFVLCVAFPLMNKSTISHKLTKDLTINPRTHEKKITNSALFIGKDKQQKVHIEKIKKFLRKELHRIEKSQL